MNYKLLGQVTSVLLLTQAISACNQTTTDAPSDTQTQTQSSLVTDTQTQVVVNPTDTETEVVDPTDTETEVVDPTDTETEVVVDPTDTETEVVVGPTDTETEVVVDPTDTETEVVVDPIIPEGVEVNGVYISAQSNQDAHLAENVYDNDDTTRWSAESLDGEAQWLQLAFAESKTVAGLDIAFLNGDERTTNFDIVALNEDGSWTTVYSGQSAGLSEDFEYFDIANTNTTAVRVIGYGNSNNGWNSIIEIEIYFDEDKDGEVTSTATQTQTQTETVTGTMTDTETQTDIVTDFYPTDIIPGLTAWKITLPVDSDGNDSTGATLVDDRNNSATEIKDENLIGYEYLPYFYASDEEVYFRAHAGGATTSGSKYPRSELRQRVGGGDGYWSVEDYQYLAVELRVTAVTSIKPEVSVVQIHGPENEPLRVQYSTSEGIYYIWNEDNTERGIDFDYELGQRLFVTVTVMNESIYLTLENLDTGDTFSDDWVSGDATGYFKVGTYTQSSMFLEEFKSEYDESPEPEEFAEIAVKSIDLYELFEGDVSISGNPVYPEEVVITETQTATETATQTETDTQTDTDITVDAYPSDVIEGLDAWKISLPVDSDGNDSSNAASVDDRNTDSTEIKDENLIDYDFLPYFYAQNNEVYFRAHAGGATTSGSKYPRSELRQRVGGGDNYWSVDDYQFLAVELRVTAVTQIKPEVSVVQIHGPENEPLRVQYSTSNGIYYIWNEDNKMTDIDFDYELGQRLFVTVTVKDGSIFLTLENLDNGATFSDDWVSGDSTGYYKVGTYTQSSMFLTEFKDGFDSNPDANDYAEIAVKSIDLYESYEGEIKIEGNPQLP